MSYIIFSEKITDREGNRLSRQLLKDTFKEAIDIQKKLLSDNKRIACFFIDPLLNSFEAANKFYFGILECDSIRKLNTYKSGAGPILAISDARELIDNDLYDAVFIFGHEPLLSNSHDYGKDEIKKAMDIFGDKSKKSLVEYYNLITQQLCSEMGFTREHFFELSDKLFDNYYRTYSGISGTEVDYNRGKFLDAINAGLFKMTDCANPNLDFAGGIIVANNKTAEFLRIPEDERIKILGVKYIVVEGLPQNIDKIVGNQDNIFPHLREVFIQAQTESGIHVAEEFKSRNLYLEVYTCFPPVPLAFLLATGLVKDADDLPEFLKKYEITITGGMNFARAPWNNPALIGLVDMYKKMKKGVVKYGLIHGNGGIGEMQGVVILQLD